MYSIQTLRHLLQELESDNDRLVGHTNTKRNRASDASLGTRGQVGAEKSKSSTNEATYEVGHLGDLVFSKGRHQLTAQVQGGDSDEAERNLSPADIRGGCKQDEHEDHPRCS